MPRAAALAVVAIICAETARAQLTGTCQTLPPTSVCASIQGAGSLVFVPLNYNLTYLENKAKNNINSAQNQVEPIFGANCAHTLDVLACASTFMPCITNAPTSEGVPSRPCNSWCLNFWSTCSTFLNTYLSQSAAFGGLGGVAANSAFPNCQGTGGTFSSSPQSPDVFGGRTIPNTLPYPNGYAGTYLFPVSSATYTLIDMTTTSVACYLPSAIPSADIIQPSSSPTSRPSASPTPPTTYKPTGRPTSLPTSSPTFFGATYAPTHRPTALPTASPVLLGTCQNYTGRCALVVGASVFIAPGDSIAQQEALVVSRAQTTASNIGILGTNCTLATETLACMFTFLPCSVQSGQPVPQLPCAASCQQVWETCSSAYALILNAELSGNASASPIINCPNADNTAGTFATNPQPADIVGGRQIPGGNSLPVGYIGQLAAPPSTANYLLASGNPLTVQCFQPVFLTTLINTTDANVTLPPTPLRSDGSDVSLSFIVSTMACGTLTFLTIRR